MIEYDLLHVCVHVMWRRKEEGSRVSCLIGGFSMKNRNCM